jgi:hypothetical protein
VTLPVPASRAAWPAAADTEGLTDFWTAPASDATLDCSGLDDLFAPEAQGRLQGHREMWCHPTLGVLTDAADGCAVDAPPAAAIRELDSGVPVLRALPALPMLPALPVVPVLNDVDAYAGLDLLLPNEPPLEPLMLDLIDIDPVPEATPAAEPETGRHASIGAFANDLRRISQDFQILLVACRELNQSTSS